MASPNYLTAYYKSMVHEGGWSNHPDDRGGETVMGISRRAHPEWEGWTFVDSRKDARGVPNLSGVAEAQVTVWVQSFYQAHFWEVCGCPQLVSQGLAEEMFDSAVNCGPVVAVKWLQEGCNLLRHSDDSLLKVDGKIGRATLAAVRMIGARNNYPRLIKLMNIMQGAHYLELVRRDPSQRHFLIGGWLNRINT